MLSIHPEEELLNLDYNHINIKKNENNIEEKLLNKSSSLNECRLMIHSFNPSKNSPPNEWQFRLIKRINSLNNLPYEILY
tara:strand:+ start:4574 stop:4813 length:240 start_codon:yes stop_codon:yes gene_type:complete